MQPTLRILGIRGVPAKHGGFETFAEYLAEFLVKRGWRVVVYCQHEGVAPVFGDTWNGIERTHISVVGSGALSTIKFDWLCVVDASKRKDVCLTLGYNTAVFCALLRLNGVRNVINMDGIEWSRAKWGPIAKAWFWMNEYLGCLLADVLVADHPSIQQHLARHGVERKTVMIPYGAERVVDADPEQIRLLGLVPNSYMTVIARPEPENSLLEIVTAYSDSPRGFDLVVLGKYDQSNAYHRAVISASKGRVKFLGAIYDKAVVKSLRYFSIAYVHGHQVGGTNPSLVEALGAACPVIAHDNRFNRWVAGDRARYFVTEADLSAIFSELDKNRGEIQAMRQASISRFEERFTWPQVLSAYEETVLRLHTSRAE